MKKINIIIFLMLLFVPMVCSTDLIFPQNKLLDLKVPCSINGAKCSASATCNINIKYPNETYIRNNAVMSNIGNGEFNITLTEDDLSKTGFYKSSMYCIDGAYNGTDVFEFKITPTGIQQTSILENPILLVITALGFILICLGIYLGIPWFGFIGSIMFLILGVYTMIYGFNDVTDMYTRGVSITLIGLGVIFMFSSAYEWIWGVETET